MLKNNMVFHWTDLEEDAFNALKQSLIYAPMLAIPDFNKKFVVETDASDKVIVAVLMQENHSLAYRSRVLRPKKQKLSTY